MDVGLIRRRPFGKLEVLERPASVAPLQQVDVAGEEQTVGPLQTAGVETRAADRVP